MLGATENGKRHDLEPSLVGEGIPRQDRNRFSAQLLRGAHLRASKPSAIDFACLFTRSDLIPTERQSNKRHRGADMSNALLRLPAVKAMTGLGRSAIYLMMSRGEFPLQRRLGRRAVGWDASAVASWVASRPPVRKAEFIQEPSVEPSPGHQSV